MRLSTKNISTHIPGQRQYEITNHLGNVIATVSDKKNVDGTAFVTTATDYYAFGSPLQGRNYTGILENKYRFGFNGQMKDDDISGEGNHNTALYWEYDTRLGRRWNLDPVKQLSVSDYATFKNNPILNVDLLGDVVTVSFRTGFLGLGGKKTVEYRNQKYFNLDGSDYTGKTNRFARQTKESLDKISTSGGEGAAALNELVSSKYIFEIRYGSGNEFKAQSEARSFNNNKELINAGIVPDGQPNIGTGGIISYNPNLTSGGPSINKTTYRPSFIGLAHEMFHARNTNRGKSYPKDQSYFPRYDAKYLGLWKEEWVASYFENIYRNQLGIPLREFYNVDQDGKGAEPKILDSNQKPIQIPQ